MKTKIVDNGQTCKICKNCKPDLNGPGMYCREFSKSFNTTQYICKHFAEKTLLGKSHTGTLAGYLNGLED